VVPSIVGAFHRAQLRIVGRRGRRSGGSAPAGARRAHAISDQPTAGRAPSLRSARLQQSAIQAEPDHHRAGTGRERGEKSDVPCQISHVAIGGTLAARPGPSSRPLPKAGFRGRSELEDARCEFVYLGHVSSGSVKA
jgi:hypothetical protein